MRPAIRKLALTAHVVASVGWLGAVAAFFAIAIAAVTTENRDDIRGAFYVMELVSWGVIVPLSVASLVTGLIQAFGTRWGLLRHHWVLAKFVINLLATTVLILYMQTLGRLTDVAAQSNWSVADRRLLDDPSPVLHSGIGLVLLLVATVLSIYKPRGLTRYGRRKLAETPAQ